MSLRSKLIKLAYDNSSLREYILPIIKESSMDKTALRVQEMKYLLDLPQAQFGVLSAYGTGSKTENQARHGQLVAELQRRGYRKFHTLRGQWEGVSEKSLLVPNMDFRDVIELGKMFTQDAVIYKSGDGVVGMYYLKGTPYAEVALRTDLQEDRELFSKSRNISFSFDFMWGKHIPWKNIRRPIGKEEVEEYVMSEAA